MRERSDHAGDAGRIAGDAVPPPLRVKYPSFIEGGRSWVLCIAELTVEGSKASLKLFDSANPDRPMLHDVIGTHTPRYRHVRNKIFSDTAVRAAWIRYYWWVYDRGLDSLGVFGITMVEYREHVFRVRRVGNLAYLAMEETLEGDVDLVHGLGCVEDEHGLRIPAGWNTFAAEGDCAAIVTRRIGCRLSLQGVQDAARSKARQQILFLRKNRGITVADCPHEHSGDYARRPGNHARRSGDATLVQTAAFVVQEAG